MIKVYIKENNIKIKGHAMYSKHGTDIVCASASSIIITSINAIMRIDEHSIDYVLDEGYINIDILNNNDITKALINNMIDLLKELELKYGKNIKIYK